LEVNLLESEPVRKRTCYKVNLL